MSEEVKVPTLKEIQDKFEEAYNFNSQIGLYDTVELNENFFIGNQWEGVKSNGLPTPVFNFLKQVVLFQVATISSDNMTINSVPLPSSSEHSEYEMEQITGVINDKFAQIIEQERVVTKLREMLRDAAVDADGCIYSYFDPDVETGQKVKGAIRCEVIENTRVHFGNPNSRAVQTQPFIILSRRRIVDEVQHMAQKYHEEGLNQVNDPTVIRPDSEKFNNKFDSYTTNKVTVLTYLYRNRETGTIWCVEATETAIIRDAYDTECTLYPITWLCWDYVQDCYHGQAMITGLIPNQKFVNKMFAMAGISLLTTAFPKVIYDRSKIKQWTADVGAAVGVNGPVTDAAKTIDGASLNPQVGQFIEMCIQNTRSFLGASDVALGDSRPDNTSAIIALQRAANTPMELTKQSLYQAIEDMGRIWLDIMASKYGKRTVEMRLVMDEPGSQPFDMNLPEMKGLVEFDFSILKEIHMAVKLDPGASSYWSEMASQQTLDNLLMNHLIDPVQYIERLPNGYIRDRSALLKELRATLKAPAPAGEGQATGISSENIPVEGGPGNGGLQRSIAKEGV